MTGHEELEDRLRALGKRPVDPSLQSAHLTAMVRVSPARRALGPKLRAAALFLAGLLVGGSGLAAADALPDPAQHVAHRALGAVGVDVPDPERYHGPECGQDTKRNHGGYVRDDHALAGTDCGKKVHAGKDGEDVDDDGAGDGRAPKDGCQGPPPWAGSERTSMTPEEKAAAQATREATCGDGEVGDADEAAERQATTTTTEATTTTTTEATTTTTSAGG